LKNLNFSKRENEIPAASGYVLPFALMLPAVSLDFSLRSVEWTALILAVDEHAQVPWVLLLDASHLNPLCCFHSRFFRLESY
jgi:hypothetical protein